MKRRFQNTESKHVFFDMYGDGLLRSVNSKLTYTMEEAEECAELTELD